MKHIVYKITLRDRKSADIRPYMYIGSKSNCTFDGQNIRDKRGNIYIGSSRFPNYRDIVYDSEYIVEILKEFESYSECLIFESNLQKEYNVVSDDRYFNLSIAMTSTFTNPGYGTYRHSTLNFHVRLPVDDPNVISGLYVNANHGFKTYNNGIEERQFLDTESVPAGWVKGALPSRSKSGEMNSFYGKTHTEETKTRIIEKRLATYDADPERYANVVKKLAETASKTFKGVPKTKESNLKRSRPGMIMLKNIHTGECIRIRREEKIKYDICYKE